MAQLSLHSPVGDLTLFEEDSAIVALEWGWVECQDETPALLRARDWLDVYFDGTAAKFALPLAPRGTAFQIRVWQEMLRIPAGQTTTYGAIATTLGSSARAVGNACGANPIPIIVPCHRVLASGGRAGGYSGDGGLDTKRALLRLEGIEIQLVPPE